MSHFRTGLTLPATTLPLADVTPSGLKGSGAFIVTLVLMVIATVIFVTKMVRPPPYPSARARTCIPAAGSPTAVLPIRHRL